MMRRLKPNPLLTACVGFKGVTIQSSSCANLTLTLIQLHITITKWTARDRGCVITPFPKQFGRTMRRSFATCSPNAFKWKSSARHWKPRPDKSTASCWIQWPKRTWYQGRSKSSSHSLILAARISPNIWSKKKVTMRTEWPRTGFYCGSNKLLKTIASLFGVLTKPLLQLRSCPTTAAAGRF